MTDAPEEPGTAPESEPAELDFDPYRFGAPEHPIPPEYAPPGYKPPPAPAPQPPMSAPPPAPHAAPYGYPPQYQAGPPPPYGTYAVQPRRSTGKAITSMVLGIASIVLSITSVFDIILVALAVVFGLLALAETNRSPQREGRGMAIAGLICAAAGTVLAVLVTVWYVHTAKQCDQYSSGSSQFQSCIRDHI